MNGVTILRLLEGAIVLGVIYSLIAAGYVIVFRASKVFNFMNPGFMLIGSLVYVSTYHADAPLGFAVGLLIALGVTGVIGGLLYRLVVDRASAQPHWIQMILTMGLSIATVNIVQVIFGTGLRTVQLPELGLSLEPVPGLKIMSNDILIVASGVVFGAIIWWLLTKSPLSLRFKATAEAPLLAAYQGISLRLWFSMAWAVAAVAAVFAGLAYSTNVPVDASLISVGLVAFPAAMLGGMESVAGAFVGGLVLAVVQQAAAYFIGTAAASPVAFAVALIVMLLKPEGLFGTPVIERV